MKFWLSDDTTNVSLGDNVKTVNLGESERQYEVERFTRSNGGYLKGIGNYTPKKFVFTRDDFITTIDEEHAWNEQRNNFMKWFTKPFYEDIYLNMSYSTDAVTLRTLVYTLKLPADEFNETWHTNFGRSFELISPSGVWESATDTTGTTNISSTSEQAVAITNNGIIECAPTFIFAPTANASVIQVKIAEDYGFKLEGTFTSGIDVEFQMRDGVMKVDNAVVDVTNYLTAGSPFLFPPSVSTFVYVTASSGVFSWEFPERYV